MADNVIVMGGLGQVGSAIASLAADAGYEVTVLDKGLRPAKVKSPILHVCIPHSKTFLFSVRKEIRYYKPKLVIVHSTVPVGTTRKFGSSAVHSPVRGQHDDLEKSIRSFVKYVGPCSKSSGLSAATHLHNMGIRAVLWDKPESTELMKGLCLSRYLNDLSFYEVAYQICLKYGVNPDHMLDWTETYNQGYDGTKYVRPRFSFPKGKVGGHCVMQVSKMLAKQTGNRHLRRNIDVFS